MNVERIDGTATDLHGLTSEEVKLGPDDPAA